MFGRSFPYRASILRVTKHTEQVDLSKSHEGTVGIAHNGHSSTFPAEPFLKGAYSQKGIFNFAILNLKC